LNLSLSLNQALLLSFAGADSKGYTVLPSARTSPKFFFRSALENDLFINF
jgi:hypothetical protein